MKKQNNKIVLVGNTIKNMKFMYNNNLTQNQVIIIETMKEDNSSKYPEWMIESGLCKRPDISPRGYTFKTPEEINEEIRQISESSNILHLFIDKKENSSKVVEIMKNICNENGIGFSDFIPVNAKDNRLSFVKEVIKSLFSVEESKGLVTL